MPALFLYLLKLSVSLGLVWLFYQLVLRQLTFYYWNRWYLLGYTLLSFFIPFINIDPVLQRHQWADSGLLQWVPLINEPAGENQMVSRTASFGPWDIAGLMVLTGTGVMLARLFIQLISIRNMRKKAELIPGTGMKLYQVNDPIIPFSFGHSIFINRGQHSEAELQEIIRHEFVHVKEKHSIDILWCEWLCIINWYNPFAWLLRRAVRQNLEYIADQQVIGQGFDRKAYQYLLLRVIGNQQYSIAPKFNFSSLKKRIAMMNKLRSTKIHLVRFLFLLPVVLVTLVAFRKANLPPGPLNGLHVQDTIPPAIPKPVITLPDAIASISVMKGKDNPGVADPLEQKQEGLVLVKRKDGKKEIYDLKSSENLLAFEKKYGVKLEELLPPPPPPPPFPPPPAPVKSVVGRGSLQDLCEEWEITRDIAWFKLKDGSIEKYDLHDTAQKAAYLKKYGPVVATDNLASVTAPVAAVAGVQMTAPSKPTEHIVSGTVAPVALISGIQADPVTTAVLATPVAGVEINSDYTSRITGNEDILVTITRNTTKQQLEEYRQQMKEKGIELTYTETEYNDKGELVNISGTMKSADGRSNFVANGFRKLILAMIKKDGRTYFKVSVKGDREFS